MSGLFVIAKNWEQSRYVCIEEWIIKLWYIHAIEYYSAIKKNGLEIQSTTWMDLKSIMLSDEALYKRVHIIRSHLYKILKKAKIIYGGKKSEWWLLLEGVGGARNCLGRGKRKLSGMMVMF